MDAASPHDLNDAPGRGTGGETGRALRRAIDALDIDQPTIGDLLDALGRSGHNLMMLLLALPAFIPIPGLPVGTVFGTALTLVAWQVLRGENTLWLPAWLRRRGIPRGPMLAALTKLEGWMVKIGKLLRPRLEGLTEGVSVSVVAGLIVILGLALVLPIPFGNQGPAFAVVVFAFGLLERDGVAILAGVALTIVSLAWNVAIVLFGAVITQNLWATFS